MAHVHFDLEDMRRRSCAALDAASAEALRLAESEDDRMFVQAQRRFADAITEFTVAGADLLNQGYNPTMVGGTCGIVLGNLFLQVSTSMRDNPAAVQAFVKWFARAGNAEGADESVGGMQAFSPVPGGHG